MNKEGLMHKKGFTLIETVIVMMLSGLILCSVSLGTKYAEQVAFTTFVKQVENGIKSAQYMANLTGKGYTVYCVKGFIYIKPGSKKPIYTFEMGPHVSLSPETTIKQVYFIGKMVPEKVGSIVLVNSRLAKKARITLRIATAKTTIYYDNL